jgi:hypothetical protein
MKHRNLKVITETSHFIGEQSKQLSIQITPSINFNYFHVEAGGFIDDSTKSYSLSFSWILWKVILNYTVIDDYSEFYTK